jgi:hypothetical protein
MNVTNSLCCSWNGKIKMFHTVKMIGFFGMASVCSVDQGGRNK